MVQFKSPVAACILTLASLLLPGIVTAQSPQDATVQSATNVLNEIMATPVNQIPRSMLADAHGVAIIPNVLKGGFVIGVRHGKGVVVVRDASGGWRPPMFLSMTGGSVGWQVGLQSSDIVLVFKSRKSIDGLMNGKFTIGADAAAAAGPVGRQASAATDARLGAEIYSYSRSRGLFAGVSLDGSALQIEAAENQAYYGGGVGPDGTVSQIPPSGLRLIETIARYTTPGGGQSAQRTFMSADSNAAASLLPPGVVISPPPLGKPVASDPAALRQQLAAASQRLQAMVDANWKQYLALPSGIDSGAAVPSPEAMKDVLNRYNAIMQDSRYAALTQHPEFKETYSLLQTYIRQLTPPAQPSLLLPPPPGQAETTPLQTPRY